jgi:hypothetical protein
LVKFFQAVPVAVPVAVTLVTPAELEIQEV